MQSRHSDFKRKMVLFALMVLVVALVASTAFAHTGLTSSSPTADETVTGPLDRVSLSFSGTPIADNDSIAVANESGVTFLPVSVDQTGNDVVATFDPPLGAGSYSLAWRIRSDDTHFVDGSFAFAVLAPVAPTTTPPTTSASASTTSQPTVVATTVADGAPGEIVPVDDVPPSTASAGESAQISSNEDGATVAPVAPVLGGGSSDEGASLTRVGRLIIFPAAVAAIGILAFAAFAFAGRREELGTLIRAVRWLGLAVLFGAMVEFAGFSSLLGGLGAAADDTAGRAALARLLGGGLLVVGFSAIGAKVPGPRARPLSAAVVEHPSPDPVLTQPTLARWRPTAFDAIGLTGMGFIIVSFAFDGHTASRGPRILHAVTSILHVSSAAMWAGGLVALAVVLWRRHHDGVQSFALEMVLRFSGLALAALALAGVAGVAMALFIDSDVLGYFGSDWGRLLILKLVLVGAAALLGAYNHFRVLPSLTAEPDDPTVVTMARRTVTIEAGLLLTAAVVTALLVAASTL